MKTKGLEVFKGVLIVPWGTGAAPVQFWNRLKHRIGMKGLLDEYRAEYERERGKVMARREDPVAKTTITLEEIEREARMFERWTLRVCGPQRVWPWQRGWTEELVDAYLIDDAPAAGVTDGQRRVQAAAG